MRRANAASPLVALALASAPVAAAARPYEGPTSVAAPVESTPPPHAHVEPTRGTPMRHRAAAAAEPVSPLRVRPVLDVAITLGAAAPSLGLALIERSLPDRDPTPGDAATIAKFDRIALGRFERAPAIASDVMLAATVAMPLVVHAIEAGLHTRGTSGRGRRFFARWGTDVLLLAEAIAVNMLLTNALKAAIHRPRPYTYLDPADVDASERAGLVGAQSDREAEWSFPSGHTSMAFTAATAGATMLTLELLGRRKRWAIALAWLGGLSLASTTAVLRVASGRHFPSDVLTSALMGAGIGAAVPLAHWRPKRRHRAARRWALVPTSSRHSGGASLIVALP